MKSNVDIAKAANILISEHGSKATEYAVMIERNYKEKGNREGSLLWQRIYTCALVVLAGEGNQTIH
jgi:hypothetical protein